MIPDNDLIVESSSVPPVLFTPCRGCEDKIRVIDAMQAQARQAREDTEALREELLVTRAERDESRRALDRYMGMRS
jgi:hypothetical protein